ncbi:MAG: AAA family ATPase [Nanoarchaeota archaeon]
MIISISGSVGTGKTSFAKILKKKLNKKEKFKFTYKKFKIIHLNDWAIDYKIEDVKKLQTFDFDIDKLIVKINTYLSENKSQNLIIEGHFAHFIDPKLVDYLFILNRDIKELEIEYMKRKYNIKKRNDNLEVENFNLCFYEGIEEGYRQEEQIFCIENNKKLTELADQIILKIYQKKS